MKYIKKYDSYDFRKLKKYIIFDTTKLEHEEGDASILGLVKYDDKFSVLMTIQLYIYKNNEIIQTKGESFAVFEQDVDINILYTSDSLDDCLDKLPTIINSNKYNL